MYTQLKTCFEKEFGRKPDYIFSAPGRTELGGNHTDHQHGKVLAAAVDRAIGWLSQQYGSGALTSLNCESWAQLIVALSELGISVEEDRFVAEGKTLKDQLLAYRTADGGFRHTQQEEKANLMATEQAFYALAAMERMEQGKSSLYSMK